MDALTIDPERAFSSSMSLANVAASILSASMPSCSKFARTSGKSKEVASPAAKIEAISRLASRPPARHRHARPQARNALSMSAT
jgi:hypothetical protein